MKLILSIVLVAAASAAPNVSKTLQHRPGPRLIDGKEATPHSLPYQAFLQVTNGVFKWWCNGALISDNYVLTSGFCVDQVISANVTLGAHRVGEAEETQVVFTTTEITIHDGFNGLGVNDVALIKLPSSVTFTPAIKPIPLPSPNDDYAGKLSTISSWADPLGYLEDALNFLQVVVISNDECRSVYGSQAVTPSMVCTSGDGNVGICNGDVGVPLVTDGVLVGISAWASVNCTGGDPSGFSRVSSYLDWIANNTVA